MLFRRAHWRRVGREPDYRFTLANERTFLAWVRTAMAILAGGIVVEQFGSHLGSHGFLARVATVLALLAALLSAAAWFQWRANEIAMRQERPLPGTLTVPLLLGTVLVAAATTIVLMLG